MVCITFYILVAASMFAYGSAATPCTQNHDGSCSTADDDSSSYLQHKAAIESIRAVQPNYASRGNVQACNLKLVNNYQCRLSGGQHGWGWSESFTNPQSLAECFSAIVGKGGCDQEQFLYGGPGRCWCLRPHPDEECSYEDSGAGVQTYACQACNLKLLNNYQCRLSGGQHGWGWSVSFTNPQSLEECFSAIVRTGGCDQEQFLYGGPGQCWCLRPHFASECSYEDSGAGVQTYACQATTTTTCAPCPPAPAPAPAATACPQQICIGDLGGEFEQSNYAIGYYENSSLTPTSCQGCRPIYRKTTPQVTHHFVGRQAGRSIYNKTTQDYFLYYWDAFKAWRIGPDYTTATAFVASLQNEGTSCPTQASAWLENGASWWDADYIDPTKARTGDVWRDYNNLWIQRDSISVEEACPTGYEFSFFGFWAEGQFGGAIYTKTTADCGQRCTALDACVSFNRDSGGYCYLYTGMARQTNGSDDITCKKATTTRTTRAFSAAAAMACPEQISVGNSSEHYGRADGLYEKLSLTPTSNQAGRPIYNKTTQGYYLYYWDALNTWRIGSDYTSADAFAWTIGNEGMSCPINASTWLEYKISHGRKSWVPRYSVSVEDACPTDYKFSHFGSWRVGSYKVNGRYVATNSPTAADCGQRCTEMATCVAFHRGMYGQCNLYTQMVDQVNSSQWIACKKAR